ncbi:hypothetical protein BS78_07G037000 [Paspalum vaginatum]|nr:hypothetical protein BS78_07G037000 [Paspalum vaginatum]
MAAARALFLVAVAVAAALGTAHGASYTVGAPAGSWDLSTNYTLWASGITFRAGDQLVFKYPRGAHDVMEVSKAGYDACSTTAPLATSSTGDDTVALPAAGVTRYFICGVPGHCAGGMKLAVAVEAAASAPAPNAAAPSPAPVAMAPRAAARPPAASSAPPSPAPVATAPRAAAPARPPVANAPGASVPEAGGRAEVPPPSSAAASAGVAGSLAGLGFGAAMAALMALY